VTGGFGAGPAKSALAFGYKANLWTKRRLAEVIERRFGVTFNSSLPAESLARRGCAPQQLEVSLGALKRFFRIFDDRTFLVLTGEASASLDKLDTLISLGAVSKRLQEPGNQRVHQSVLSRVLYARAQVPTN